MQRRIFGLETEFGVTCTFHGQRRLSPDEVARYLFRRVVSWGRSSNVFLRNGARLYLDVGSHPEYATAECDSLSQLVAHDKAGERILEDLLVDAERRLVDEASAATSTCSRTTPTPRATPTAATRTTWSPGQGSSPASRTCCCRSSSPAS
jgi:Pup-ligase protein